MEETKKKIDKITCHPSGGLQCYLCGEKDLPKGKMHYYEGPTWRLQMQKPHICNDCVNGLYEARQEFGRNSVKPDYEVGDVIKRNDDQRYVVVEKPFWNKRECWETPMVCENDAGAVGACSHSDEQMHIVVKGMYMVSNNDKGEYDITRVFGEPVFTASAVKELAAAININFICCATCGVKLPGTDVNSSLIHACGNPCKPMATKKTCPKCNGTKSQGFITSIRCSQCKGEGVV